MGIFWVVATIQKTAIFSVAAVRMSIPTHVRIKPVNPVEEPVPVMEVCTDNLHKSKIPFYKLKN